MRNPNIILDCTSFMGKTVISKLVLLLGSAIVLIGCSDLKTDLPTPTGATGKVHAAGWLDTTSTAFHGTALRKAGWNLSSCQSCHGGNYAGGTVGYSCRRCHTETAGPEACNACHGNDLNPAPPRDTHGGYAQGTRGVGAHQSHLNGSTLAHAISCAECHTVPATLRSPGHIDSTGRAHVLFQDSLALTVTNSPGTEDYDDTRQSFTPAPVYNPTTLSCASTYCHGNFKNGNANNAPVWTDSQAACGTCHGDITKPIPERARPKTLPQGGSHPVSTACFACHDGIVDASGNILDPAKHINGLLNVYGDERAF